MIPQDPVMLLSFINLKLKQIHKQKKLQKEKKKLL